MNNRGEQSTILVVCTGNVCRSPLAQALLHDTVAQLSRDVFVTSAGTGALTGEQPPAEILSQAQAWGLELASHAPTQITEEAVQNAELILTAERSHRANIVAMVPSASRKVFTLKQFARIAQSMLEDAEPSALDALRSQPFALLVNEIADHRALTPPPMQPADDDIADPFRRNQRDYDASAEEIRETIEALATFFERTGPRS